MRRFGSIAELKSALGEDLGPSDWIKIEQQRIDAFADATDDYQWIHVDEDRAAREMPEGRTIAHGFLTLSLIPQMRHQIWRLESLVRAINYGLEKVRFPAPVMEGDRIRMRETPLAMEPMDEGFRLLFRCNIEIEGRDKPACVAETVTLLYERV